MTSAGGTLVRHVAKWDGTNWSSPGSGIDGPVEALGANREMVFVGGNFVKAGLNYSANFAIWHAFNASPTEASVAYFGNGTLIITWNSIAGTIYQVFSTTDLSQPFSPLGGPILAGGTTTSYTNSYVGTGARFFRIGY